MNIKFFEMESQKPSSTIIAKTESLLDYRNKFVKSIMESSIPALLNPPEREKCTKTRFYISKILQIYTLNGNN